MLLAFVLESVNTSQPLSRWHYPAPAPWQFRSLQSQVNDHAVSYYHCIAAGMAYHAVFTCRVPHTAVLCCTYHPHTCGYRSGWWIISITSYAILLAGKCVKLIHIRQLRDHWCVFIGELMVAAVSGSSPCYSISLVISHPGSYPDPENLVWISISYPYRLVLAFRDQISQTRSVKFTFIFLFALNISL